LLRFAGFLILEPWLRVFAGIFDPPPAMQTSHADHDEADFASSNFG
jgi:hypothetical protein